MILFHLRILFFLLLSIFFKLYYELYPIIFANLLIRISNLFSLIYNLLFFVIFCKFLSYFKFDVSLCFYWLVLTHVNCYIYYFMLILQKICFNISKKNYLIFNSFQNFLFIELWCFIKSSSFYQTIHHYSSYQFIIFTYL